MNQITSKLLIKEVLSVTKLYRWGVLGSDVMRTIAEGWLGAVRKKL